MFASFTRQAGRRSVRKPWLWSLALHVAIALTVWATVPNSRPAPTPPEPAKYQRVTLTAPSLRLPKTRPPTGSATQLTVVPRRSRFEGPNLARARQPKQAIQTDVAQPRVEPTQLASIALPPAPDVAIERPAHVETLFGTIDRTQTDSAKSAAMIGGFESVERTTGDSPLGAPVSAAAFSDSTRAHAAQPTGAGQPAGFDNATGVASPLVALAKPHTDTGFGTVRRERQPSSLETEGSVGSARSTPAKILSKPLPQYTDQARAQRIEGDVVLLVRFMGSGSVNVVRVVSGLGYGLDQRAIEAAKAIKFEPATQDNSAVDAVAQISIRFELAY